MSIILHILCRNIDFSKGVLLLWSDGLDIWKCTLHSFKGHGATEFFKDFFIFCLDIVPAKQHTALPQRKVTLIQKGMLCLF